MSYVDGCNGIPDMAYDMEAVAASRINISVARRAKVEPTVCSRRIWRMPSRSRLGGRSRREWGEDS